MKNFFILLISLFVVNGISAQSCLPEGIELTTQSQIDNFQVNYPNCTQIDGDVLIAGADITNLDGLSVLTSIGGNLTMFSNEVLANLTGLDNVVSINGDVNIGMSFNFNFNFGNPALVNLSGLDNLNLIGGTLYIHFNDSLNSLNGLNNLTSIGGGLDIGDSPLLTNLTGLDSLTSVGGDLFIANNAALKSLSGLEGLTSVGGAVKIGYYELANPALEDITGLQNLENIGGYLYIANNYSLTSLAGLNRNNLNPLANLYIYYNSSLSTCDVKSICDYLIQHDTSTFIGISGNFSGCDNQQEVEAACGVGVDEPSGISRQSSVLSYPNPSANDITVELLTGQLTKNTFLTICNTSGQALALHRITNKQTVIDVSGLPQGVYFLRLTDEKTVIVSKFIKQ